MKYDLFTPLYSNKKAGVHIGGFSGVTKPAAEGEQSKAFYAIAVGGWTENRKAFRWGNFMPVDAQTYLHIAHNPKRDFDFTYKGKSLRFSSVAALADFLNKNELR